MTRFCSAISIYTKTLFQQAFGITVCH